MRPSRGILSASLHLILFLLTFFTTTLAGVSWANRDFQELSNFGYGLPYSLSILAILAAHEFGHYFAAKYHRVDTSLPYFIPIPHFLLNPFGTMGAVIRIRSPLTRNKVLFDVGIAGPLAGLAVTAGILLYGITTLPPKDFIYTFHPDYRLMTSFPGEGFTFGNSLLFWALGKISVPGGFFPPMNEVYHYPYLCAGWFGLFVTAINLMPVGQLDGGHILYALVGSKRQTFVAKAFFGTLVLVGLIGLVPFIDLGFRFGTEGWLVWALIMVFLIKLKHPEVPDLEPIDQNRRLLGWATLLLLIFIFPPVPFME
ncbi:MAG TPA: site-2 protease family protein [Bacteroidota bacterium]|nr:site-2 protease family protein [Bacteroidota bacterium]